MSVKSEVTSYCKYHGNRGLDKGKCNLLICPACKADNETRYNRSKMKCWHCGCKLVACTEKLFKVQWYCLIHSAQLVEVDDSCPFCTIHNCRKCNKIFLDYTDFDKTVKFTYCRRCNYELPRKGWQRC